MMILKQALLIGFLLAVAGCGSKAPDKEMTTSPVGMWIGKSKSEVSLDIQGDGSIKLIQGKSEQLGTWKQKGVSSMDVTFANGAVEMPYTRRDLTLRVQLPGESSQSEFEQM